MKQLTILIDMDGTIEKLLDVWLDRLNKKYNQSVTPDKITNWDISRFYDVVNPIQVKEILFDDTIWKEIKPMEGAQETKKYYMDLGIKSI